MKLLSFLSIAIITSIAVTSCEEESSIQPKYVDGDTTQAEIREENQGMKVAYIYGDSLNKHYDFLIDAEADLQKEQKLVERRIKRKRQDAEKRAAELQQQAPTMTQNQMQEAQLEMQNLDIELQQYQQRLGTEFRQSEIDMQNEYLDRVNSFLDEFNSDGEYDMILNFQPGGNLLWIKDKYDITDEVIDGLNEQYAAGTDITKTDTTK
jgi:outer membrane protein